MRRTFDNKRFGVRLRHMRKKAGMTMEHVAQCAYISQSVICRYESGEVTPTIDRVFALANLYGCSMDWLCGLKEEEYDE